MQSRRRKLALSVRTLPPVVPPTSVSVAVGTGSSRIWVRGGKATAVGNVDVALLRSSSTVRRNGLHAVHIAARDIALAIGPSALWVLGVGRSRTDNHTTFDGGGLP